MQKIDISSELERFEAHLNNNERTILSAQFGDGKTSFLEDFIHTRGNQYIFVKLRPINYVVAPNEDVFEYIKRDVLKELCIYKLVDEHVLKNVAKGIVNTDNAVEAIGFVTQTFLKFKTGLDAPVSESLKNFVENYKKHSETLKSYYKSFELLRGGIYEEDAYTMLIRESLQRVQKRKTDSKQCILIIEDLDRLDPAHLFRILNVLGAHIDEKDGGNKFGFDKIVLVMDHIVTKSIFKHFYGEKANYEGYMDKFLSHHVFEYSLLRQARSELVNYFNEECLLSEEDLKQFCIGVNENGRIISLREKIDTLSLRDIVKLLDAVDESITNEIRHSSEGDYSTVAPITRFLTILVRMHIIVHRQDLEKYFRQAPLRMSCLAGFLLETPGLKYGIHEIGNNWYSFSPVQLNDDLMTMQVFEANGGHMSEKDISAAIKKALETAYLYVMDLKQSVK